MSKLLSMIKKKNLSLEERLKLVKNGIAEERENLIEEYNFFIIKAITKTTNSYVEIENDDEFSIGLIAFNEAIDKYEFSKGKFLPFAEMIIRSRIIDYKRKELKVSAAVSVDDDRDNIVHYHKEFKLEDFTDNYSIKEQLQQFEAILETFHIHIRDLVDESPKHMDARLNCIKIARCIFENEDLKEYLYRTKNLPTNKLLKYANITQKILKRNRKFIISILLALDSQLDLLKDYIFEVEGRD